MYNGQIASLVALARNDSCLFKNIGKRLSLPYKPFLFEKLCVGYVAMYLLKKNLLHLLNLCSIYPN